MTSPLERNPTDSFNDTALRRACEVAFREPSMQHEVAVVNAARNLVRDLRHTDVPPEQMLVGIKRALSVDHLPGAHEARAAARWDQLCQRAVRACISQYYSQTVMTKAR